jgi:hypothetical protein
MLQSTGYTISYQTLRVGPGEVRSNLRINRFLSASSVFQADGVGSEPVLSMGWNHQSSVKADNLSCTINSFINFIENSISDFEDYVARHYLVACLFLSIVLYLAFH